MNTLNVCTYKIKRGKKKNVVISRLTAFLTSLKAKNTFAQSEECNNINTHRASK
jgi:hypothetical protein